MENSCFIQIKDLVKVYKDSDQPALNGITLDIKENEIFGLLGPNGAGKTTMIKVLCGLFPPTSGSIRICRYDIVKDLEKIKQFVGVVPQDIALYPSLTASENMRFFGGIYGLKGKVLKEKTAYYLELFGLEKSAGKRISSFSGGMKRRINLICGIMHEPKVLFLDEPTVGIDVQSKKLILDNLAEINKKGTTIIYTSHLMQEAETLCHNIGVIDEGRIIQAGSPAQLIEKYPGCRNLEDVYLLLTGKSLRD